MTDYTADEFRDAARARGDYSYTSCDDLVWPGKRFSVSWENMRSDGTKVRAFGTGATRREAVAEAEANQEELMGVQGAA